MGVQPARQIPVAQPVYHPEQALPVQVHKGWCKEADDAARGCMRYKVNPFSQRSWGAPNPSQLRKTQKRIY